MRAHYLTFIICLSFLLCLTKSITLGTYKSTAVNNPTNGIYDLVNIVAACPKNGAMKTVRLVHENNQLYYQMQCFSSNTQGETENEYDDAVIKEYKETKQTNFDLCTDNRFIWIDRHQIDCTKDFALSWFKLLKSGSNCSVQYGCVAVKSIYEDVSFTSKQTNFVGGGAGNISYFTQIIGDTGNNRNALHNFRLRMDYSITNWQYKFYYGIITLRDMAAVKVDYLAKSKALRDSNKEK